MASAELSSIQGALGDLERRIAEIAHRYEGTEDEELVAVLYEAERSMRAAARHLERAGRLAP